MQPDAEQGVRPLLLHGGDSPASSVDRSSPRRGGPQGLRAFRWNAGLPTAFILGGLLTLCVIFLAGDSLGLHNVSAVRPALLERKPAEAGLQAAGARLNGAAAAAFNTSLCPQAEPAACPEVKPCPACNKCPALPPAAAPCPACPKQRECPKPPPPCPKQQQQQQQKQQGADDGEGQHDADEDAKAAEKKGDGGGGAKPAADAPPQERPLRLPWAPLLSASEVQRGVGYHGSGRRLEALAAKLLRGEPIRAYTIGGSVTCGSGSSSDAASYPGRFFQFINATFPHRDHVLVNKGVGATSSGIFSACIEHMLPQDVEVDLVVVEFTVNDYPDVSYTDPQRKGYEQLLRKLLRMPGPPAVVQLHHYAWWRSLGDGVDAGLFYYPQAEAQHYVFSQYYDVPSVSLRSATWHLMNGGVPPFEVERVTARHKPHVSTAGVKIPHSEEKEAHRYFYYDRTHPNDRGHQVIAELLAGLVLKAADRVRAGGAPGWSVGWAAERDAKLPPTALPEPMVPGNDDAPSTLCAMQEEFKDIVVAWKGFNYTAERPDEDTFVGQKWGWTSSTPGDWAELEFDSRPNSDAKDGEGGRATIYLTHLKSYEGMGTAEVKCVRGCQCKKAVLDGTWDTEASLMQNLRFKVSPAAKCRVRVTVSNKAGKVAQKGHKVKLMAIMASHFPLRLNQAEDQTEVVASRVEV